MKLTKKSKVQKDLKKIITVNNDIKVYISDVLLSEVNEKHTDNLQNVISHLDNLNVIFTNLIDSTKKQ